MEKLGRKAVIDQILDRRLSAIIRTQNQALGRDAMQAAVQGGFQIVEFTLTTPGALDLISEFAKDDGLLVGAGTVLGIDQARQAAEAGASFLVSPICDPQIIAEAARLNVASIPGTFTPTEMVAAHRCGGDFVKLFPAPARVAEYVAAILGPLPFLRIFPTAGVTEENVLEVLRAGAAGAGFVRALFSPSDMADRNFAAIERRAIAIIRRLRDL